VITLPEAVKGKVVLVCIAFMQSTQSMIDSWVQPFKKAFGKDGRFEVYEIPMISAGWKVFSWMIDSGMRVGIPVERHDRVVTFYGDYSGYQKVLEMENTNLIYVFLLDQEGVIRWKGKGHSNTETEKEFLDAAMTLKK
jgi:hypothetical protein